MDVIVDFEYGKPVIMTAYKHGNQFMKSELAVKIPAKPYYEKEINTFAQSCSITSGWIRRLIKLRRLF